MFENKLISRKYYLPELKVLKVRSEKIDKSFANFDIPKVREIYLNNSTLEPGCLQDLSKLQNLRWLNLDNSVISSTDIDSILESNTLERIWTRGIKIIGIGTEEAIDKLEKKFEVVS